MKHFRSLHIISALLITVGVSLALPNHIGVPNATAASGDTIVEKNDGTMSATEREAQRREKIRSRIHRNTRAYVDVIKSAELPTSSTTQIVSTSYKARLLCRVKSRYTDSTVSSASKQRLVERVSQDLSLAPIAVVNILEGILDCDEVLGGRYPYLFYAGNDNPTPTTVLPSNPATQPLIVPTPTPVVAQNTSSAPTTEESDIEESEIAEVEAEEDVITQETMMRILCRVRERGIRDIPAFERSIPDVSARFSERWDIDQDSIASALRNNKICTQPASIVLIESTKVEEPEQFGPPAPANLQDETEGSTIMNRIKGLPPIILIVGGMTVFTFIALMLLIILPLFKIQE